MMIFQVLLVLLAIVAADSQMFHRGYCPKPPVQEDFNVTKYMGTWYEIEKLPAVFERGTCNQATYKLLPDGTVSVRNAELLSNGKISSIEAVARVKNSSQPAILGVSFFRGLPEDPYWVLSTDYQSYALVYSCSDYAGFFHVDFAWILARTRTLTEDLITQLHDKLAVAGVDVKGLTVSNQTGCVLVQEVKRQNQNQTAYIAASYVKFLESAGARVVPVMINQTRENYTRLFNSINGVLYPGGVVSIVSSAYARTAEIFYELAIEANNRGDYFPVWGTCLGIQQLMRLTSRKTELTRTNTKGVPLPQNLTNDAKDSRMFKDFPAELMKDLALKPVTAHCHYWSVSMQTYSTDEELTKFYKVLSTNSDDRDIEFVSTIEAYDYPIYGTQWHPEKSPFEWRKPYYPHCPSAVKVSFYMAEFFVNEARKSLHRFESEEEEQKALIHNYNPSYTGHKSCFEQQYYF